MMFSSKLRIAVMASMLSAVPATAVAADWSACSKEIKEHCKGSKGDEAIYACLEKLDHQKKLSKKCDTVHDKYEKDTGKEDKDGKDDEKSEKK